MEKLGKEGLGLIPLPSVISAGCGLAWVRLWEQGKKHAGGLEAGHEPSAVHEILLKASNLALSLLGFYRNFL